MPTNVKIADGVNEIIQTNLDRVAGYSKAAEQAEDIGLQAVFRDGVQQSREYLTQLQPVVVQLGGTIISDTSTAGDLYRGWMGIKEARSANNSKAVLESCEKGEDAALKAYQKIRNDIADADWDASDVQQMLTAQEEGIRSMHDRIKSLRDQAK